MRILKYTRTPGAKISEKEAGVYGRELKRLVDKNGGMLTTELVVNAASDPQSPIRRFFEWDDKRAAGSWRLRQANKLINFIAVEVMVKGKRHRIPFMESVQIEVKTPQGGTEIIRRYITVKTLEREPEARGQVAADAVAMIEEAIEILEHVRVLGQKRKNKGRLLATIICQLKTYIKTL